ncbi:alpha/beta-hydrolase [Dothidotthia symphoricarpi CBS 119687]|uniref:Carboxylic ester hydrolase n=1 Tax=Dothidotthia symphoricarpi CBS 119687 TaxID=1392245 RepID=A0A6A6AL36_9PLEO|nr:alpha/beta-hydrolase [Dothidotthia symphoricarpi CBS 119687]KAF2131848.1 alpha/beta-hydrolase [Dothidotthia symphoricarpi CBS 119687]
MSDITLKHARLGSIKCLLDSSHPLVKISGLPYGTISQRFARSELLQDFASAPSELKKRYKNGVFDATAPGPSSIQPWDEEQSENCLNVSITLPQACLDSDQNLRRDAKLPVLVFIHGGAFFLGSAKRPYYDATNLMRHAIQRETPVVFVGINYRLGALGFLHCPGAGNLAPENNGLHDQDLAFDWLRENIEDFGGDVGNVTVIGQSAGGESISVKTMRKPLFKRAIMFSGTPVTMPSMTHEEHGANFSEQAEKLGIRVKNDDGGDRVPGEVAREMIDIDVGKIRELAWVGLPCANSTFFPVERPTMELTKKGKLAPEDWQKWAKPVEAQIVGSTTYDGGISYNMMSKDKSRKEHAKSFAHIAEDVLGAKSGKELCEIYGLTSHNDDPDALQRICLFESDIGFFAAALSVAEGDLVENTYFQVFDLPNPFPGPIRDQGAFATHTFDIVTLLGGVHEDRLPETYTPVVSEWRDRILDFAIKGTPPCARYMAGRERKALLVDEHGVEEVESKRYLENHEKRRQRLFDLADRVAGEAGRDVLWVDVCRRFLMKGE